MHVYIVSSEVSEMRFEEVIENLYEKYTQAVSKEKKIEIVKEKAKELGFSEVNVEFDEKAETARAVIELDETKLNEECYRKLSEIAEWLVSEKFYVTKLKLVVTTTKIEQGDTAESTLEKANKISLNYLKCKRVDIDSYIDIFEIERDDESGVFVYLLVYNEESS